MDTPESVGAYFLDPDANLIELWARAPPPLLSAARRPSVSGDRLRAGLRCIGVARRVLEALGLIAGYGVLGALRGREAEGKVAPACA